MRNLSLFQTWSSDNALQPLKRMAVKESGLALVSQALLHICIPSLGTSAGGLLSMSLINVPYQWPSEWHHYQYLLVGEEKFEDIFLYSQYFLMPWLSLTLLQASVEHNMAAAFRLENTFSNKTSLAVLMSLTLITCCLPVGKNGTWRQLTFFPVLPLVYITAISNYKLDCCFNFDLS